MKLLSYGLLCSYNGIDYFVILGRDISSEEAIKRYKEVNKIPEHVNIVSHRRIAVYDPEAAN